MPGPFPDHFSSVSSAYAQFRPRYPAALFAYVCSLSPRRERAWDAATGNGQAAVGLAEHFAEVIASDASASQIAHATPHPRVAYRVALAEASGLDDASVDLVTVAQAMHWLDVDRFFDEARRVLRPDGILAIWGYQLLRVAHERLERLVAHYYSHVVGPWWPPQRVIVEDGYRSLRFPFPEIDAPPFAMEARMSLEDLAGFVATWSATRRCREGTGRDPLAPFVEALRDAWPADVPAVEVRWPMALRIGRAS